MDPAKLDTMANWPTPTKKKEVQAFLGFANYYRRFIAQYSAKARPLTELTKDIPFSWGARQQQAFDELRAEFMAAPILTQFDRTLETIMETDASNQAIAGVLSQYHIHKPGNKPYVELTVKTLHPVDYHSKTLDSAQRNWPIHDKELFAIVDCFRKWRAWLVGVPVNIFTDHQGLQYFNTKQRLNSRQATWYQKLAEFRFTITYRPGSKMGKPDALSRRAGEEKSGAEERLLKEGQLLLVSEREEDQEGLTAEDPSLENIDVSAWPRRNNGLLEVPPGHKLEVLRQCHDSKVAGHWGKARTEELVSRNFVWENWQEDVASYVAG